jgi:RimJ/RimL family protein N-acetyltransferase
MSEHRNRLGQPIGAPLPDWTPRPRPPRTAMTGRFCRLEPLGLDHADALHDAVSLDKEGRNWTYLPVGPFPSRDAFRAWVEGASTGDDPIFYAIIDEATHRPVGYASLMRIDPKAGAIEVGHINYSPLLQRRPAATEAMYLLMRRVFDELGYRRYEWKCDSLNEPSRAAAARLGFTYEGLFRQATVTKQRNRDTAWFSIIDSEWRARKTAFERWLSPDNFDADGKQRASLASFAG